MAFSHKGIDVINTQPSDLSKLVEEYVSLIPDSVNTNWELIEAKLIDVHEWTPEAATALVCTAKQCGWFFLRNACALAIACGNEDGELGI